MTRATKRSWRSPGSGCDWCWYPSERPCYGTGDDDSAPDDDSSAQLTPGEDDINPIIEFLTPVDGETVQGPDVLVRVNFPNELWMARVEVNGEEMEHKEATIFFKEIMLKAGDKNRTIRVWGQDIAGNTSRASIQVRVLSDALDSGDDDSAMSDDDSAN